MPDYLTQILLALITAGFFGEVVRGWLQRKKVKSAVGLDDANATQIIVGSATSLLSPLRLRVEELETETTVLRRNLVDANTKVIALETKVEELVALLNKTTAENKRVTEENRKLRLRLAKGMTS
jgi:predicted RNase H-like nuclease (RuvC/YqgF family)